MLIPMLFYYSEFIDNKRYKKSTSNPNQPRRRRQSGTNLDYDKDNDRFVQRFVLRQHKKDLERQARERERFIQEENERAEMFANLDTLKGLTKEEYRDMRKQNFFLMERTSADGDFW